MSKAKPGIIVGLGLGVLLVLTTLITAVTKVGGIGCCNCLWPIVGGCLGTAWYIKSAPARVRAGDGAVVGLVVGIVGGLIDLVLAIPINYFFGNVALMEAQIHQVAPNFPLSGLAILVVAGLIGFVIFIILALVGGVIGVPLFEKRK